MASMLFGGISGSAMADVSALGPAAIDIMKRDGDRADFSAALAAVSAIQGPIIPPGIPMVIFASVTNVSVGALFFGGAIPGILIGAARMLVAAIIVKRRGFPRNIQKIRFVDALRVFMTAAWYLVMPLVILGGILLGVFAATAAFGYAFVIALIVYRTLTWNTFFDCLVKEGLPFIAVSISILFMITHSSEIVLFMPKTLGLVR